jgi:hypothetical protein
MNFTSTLLLIPFAFNVALLACEGPMLTKKSELTELVRVVQTTITENQERVLATREQSDTKPNLYYDYPGNSGNVCSIEELRAEVAAYKSLKKIDCECP